ncbi:unnamed protein product [Paramecium octaurelia]|uniref:Uncharacterized protein n=1 Tax=Paramecium octaurelia TaxID=43137 RepID=A0A8S1SEL4_PAROT|nr:unnamed protein product [Paramecium octaurelia]
MCLLFQIIPSILGLTIFILLKRQRLNNKVAIPVSCIIYKATQDHLFVPHSKLLTVSITSYQNCA